MYRQQGGNPEFHEQLVSHLRGNDENRLDHGIQEVILDHFLTTVTLLFDHRQQRFPTIELLSRHGRALSGVQAMLDRS